MSVLCVYTIFCNITFVYTHISINYTIHYILYDSITLKSVFHSLISCSLVKRKMPLPWADPMGFIIHTPPTFLNSSTNIEYLKFILKKWGQDRRGQDRSSTVLKMRCEVIERKTQTHSLSWQHKSSGNEVIGCSFLEFSFFLQSAPSPLHILCHQVFSAQFSTVPEVVQSLPGFQMRTIESGINPGVGEMIKLDIWDKLTCRVYVPISIGPNKVPAVWVVVTYFPPSISWS